MKIKLIYSILIFSWISCAHNKEQINHVPYIDDKYDKAELRINIDSMIATRSLVDGFFQIEEDSVTLNDWFDEATIYDEIKSTYLKKNNLATEEEYDIPVTEVPPPPLPPALISKLPHTQDTTKNLIVVLSNRQILTDDVWKENEFIYYQAYPVFVINPTDTIQSVDFESRMIYMVQQAKDENGNWKEIEYWHNYGMHCCGGPKLDLLPSYGFITKTPIFSGDFETEIRIKFFSNGHIYYSNTVNGKINKAQFIVPASLKSEEGFIPRKYMLSEN